MIYHTTANTINTADMQNNQFCYDRTSVPLYSSGPGDTQDARSLPPGNPVNHQLGGKSCDHLMSCDHHFVIITPPPPFRIRPSLYLKYLVSRDRLQRHETYCVLFFFFFFYFVDTWESTSFSIHHPPHRCIYLSNCKYDDHISCSVFSCVQCTPSLFRRPVYFLFYVSYGKWCLLCG